MTLVLIVNCRACNRECGDYKHLLDEVITDGESTTLAAVLKYCTTLECFAEDDDVPMPEHICNKCVEQLVASYLFKEMVLQTDTDTRERIKSEYQTAALASSESIEDLEESESVEPEIDVVKVGENQPEEFSSIDKDEEIQNVHKEATGYGMVEWLDIDDVSVASKTPPVGDYDDDHADNDSKENVSKFADDVENNDDDFIIMDEEFSNSDTVEDFIGFEKENKQIEKDNLEETPSTEQDQTNKVVKKRFVKHFGLTEEELQCKYCGKQFSKMCRLREHTYVHTGEKPHVCSLCGKRSRTKTHYNVHMLTHSNEKRYHCSICGQNYRTSTSLRVHERKHSDIRPYECTLCDRKFHTSEQKKMHIMMHTGERPFSCELCGKSYRDNHSLKQHLLSHGDKKPFQCEVCGKGLTQMSGYKRHMLLHTNQFPYSCDICNRPFRISSNLLTHRRLHFDKQPYPCTKCDKTFNNSTRLKRHLAQHEQDPTKDTFKPRKSRQETVIVDTKMSRSRVVEVL